MEFHISRQARERYQFDQSLYQYRGNVIFADFHAARLFAQKINQQQDLVNFPERAVKAGQINAMGLIDEILHHVIALYRQQKEPTVMERALLWLEERVGAARLDQALTRFTRDFPPAEVYQQHQTVEEYLKGSHDGLSNRAAALEELLMLWVANKNPAFAPYLELFDDGQLEAETAYVEVVQGAYEFLNTQPPFGPQQQNLLDM
ncbi:MAG: alpha-amylase, partial [Chloroflexi bacterium]|nr:alpha-amylase [Chloroflexota bacterium]